MDASLFAASNAQEAIVAFNNAGMVGSAELLRQTHRQLQEHRASLSECDAAAIKRLLTTALPVADSSLAAIAIHSQLQTNQLLPQVISAGRFASDALLPQCMAYYVQQLQSVDRKMHQPSISAISSVLAHHGLVDLVSQLSSSVAIRGEALCVAGRLDEAEALSLTDKSLHLSLLRAYARRANVTKAHKYFHLVSSSSASSSASSEDSLLYTLLIEAHARRGLSSDCLSIYRQMRRKSIEASHDCYAHMIRAYGVSHSITKAVAMFNKKRLTQGFTPSLEMVSALMEAYVAVGDSLNAWRVASQHLTGHSHCQTADQIGSLLANDAFGKHLDYIRDRMRLSALANVHRGHVLTSMMQSLVPSLMESGSTAEKASFALDLYNEFTLNDIGCARHSVPPLQAHMTAMLANAYLKRSSEEIFRQSLEDASHESSDSLNCLYATSLQALAITDSNNVSKAVSLLNELESRVARPSADLLESFLLCVDNKQDAFDKHVRKWVQGPYAFVVPRRHLILNGLIDRKQFIEAVNGKLSD